MQRRALQVVLLVMVLLLLTGCGAPIMPVTTGAHTSHSAPNNGVYVVWANHIGAENYITSRVLGSKFRVVERARLQEIFEEQRIRLTHTKNDFANILLVGRLVGASRIIFADIESDQLFRDKHITVAVRSVAVESAEVQWSGTASLNQAVNSVEAAVLLLTELAISRATCRTEAGYRWAEVTKEEGGCIAPVGRGGDATKIVPTYQFNER